MGPQNASAAKCIQNKKSCGFNSSKLSQTLKLC